jgi:hypothetical protein
MKLSDFYPDPQPLIKSELDVLNFLRNHPYIRDVQSQFAQAAHTYYNRFKDNRTGFEFSSHLSVRHAELFGQAPVNPSRSRQSPNLHLVLSAQIALASKNLYGNVSYCLAVCRIRSSHPSILRKFHFDVVVDAGDNPARRQPHPTTHLQYCGDIFPCLANLGCRRQQLDQMHLRLSEPRIFFWPMSLALLIDMALREFPDSTSIKLREASEWRDIVRSQEKLVLQPFYQKCVEVIVDRNSTKRTLADEFYVR